jgi:hypothetical protein
MRITVLLRLARAACTGVVLLVLDASGAGAAPASFEVARKTLTSSKGVSIEAEAGRLAVPENRSRPGSRTIQVGFLRLKSNARSPRAPIFYLAGGPVQRAV